MSRKALGLYYNAQKVGTLTEDPQNQIEFTYEDSWNRSSDGFAISQSLRGKKTDGIEAQNYFANLLPEGDVRLDVCRKLGISNDNDFELLKALGGECAGALVISEEPPSALKREYQKISPADLKKRFHEGLSVLSGVQDAEHGIRLSLAGAQDKIPVLFKNDELFLPQNGALSSHILKFPSHRGFKEMPENEYLMSCLARKLKLPFPRTQLLDLGGLRVYLIERYDRLIVQDGNSERLHQEDLCQALGYSYKKKYEKDGGPTFQQVYQGIENGSASLPQDLEKALRWLIFNVAVGNCDAHAKNISLVMLRPNLWSLSPFYDIVCTRAYPRITTLLAMKIGGADDSGTITGTHWKRLAKDISTGAKFILELVEEIATSVPEQFKEVQTEFEALYGKNPITSEIQEVLRSQCRRLLSQLKK